MALKSYGYIRDNACFVDEGSKAKKREFFNILHLALKSHIVIDLFISGFLDTLFVEV